MKSLEQTLWDYLDGNCTSDEYEKISKLIATDEAYLQKYNELIGLNEELLNLELEEPSMGFTYNVLVSIREQELKKPLKTTINKNIISGIAIFFVSTIFLLLGYTLYSINWTGFSHVTPPNLGLKPIQFDKVITKPLMQGFLFFDLVLFLYFIHDFFSRKLHHKEQSV
jgi:hypothetical protein